ncbi:quinone oxidoreductase family protein [Rhodococcus koreensis]|uniref:NADPH2:quinone reductase n=1 Tax=Rhodococcus koreensis TaxID=99653 RepID=A0A1H4KVW6_9NOCA|nr:quinone oxidoreductase [Rhodococcus koreensis]SEB62356.1 NADPH2:quinone reductase [Rhodococcus koreensis]
MKAIVVNENGGSEKVTLSEIDTPEPGAGQLQVAVATAGVNYLDIYQRQGAAPAPFVGGVEGVGRVTKVGSGVDANLVGRRVGWLGASGSFAETVVLDEAKAVAIPDDVTNEDAVALLMQGITAHYLATSAFAVGKDSTVLVHAAAGGVGRLLTQIAHHLGAAVIATASTEEKRNIALEAGADHAIGYDSFADAVQQITDGHGVDVVYDGIGRDTVEAGLKSLAVRGTLVVIGAASGPPPAIEFSALAVKSLSVIRPSVAHFTARPGELSWRADEVFGWARDGVISTAIAGRYSLKDTAKAQQDLTSRSLAGKLLIEVAPISEG